MNSLVETGLAQVQAPYSLQQLVEALSAALPSHCVLFREEDTRPYECDGLSLYRALPAVVALPETEEQVQAVMRICKRLKVPVVARGAGTGLSGGAMPHGARACCWACPSSIASSTSTWPARPRWFNPACATWRSPRPLRPHGLYYAPDPSSQIACSIGGNVAENSGGVHCLKYGLTVHNVLRVRMVTVEGERGRTGL